MSAAWKRGQRKGSWAFGARVQQPHGIRWQSSEEKRKPRVLGKACKDFGERDRKKKKKNLCFAVLEEWSHLAAMAL